MCNQSLGQSISSLLPKIQRVNNCFNLKFFILFNYKVILILSNNIQLVCYKNNLKHLSN